MQRERLYTYCRFIAIFARPITPRRPGGSHDCHDTGSLRVTQDRQASIPASTKTLTRTASGRANGTGTSATVTIDPLRGHDQFAAGAAPEVRDAAVRTERRRPSRWARKSRKLTSNIELETLLAWATEAGYIDSPLPVRWNRDFAGWVVQIHTNTVAVVIKSETAPPSALGSFLGSYI